MDYSSNLILSKISGVCPIDGISIGDPNNPATWRIDFNLSATTAQQQAAQQALAVITPASLAAADATVSAAAAAIPNPLATATAQAVSNLPSPQGATGPTGPTGASGASVPTGA
jgi:hypothetical protein